MSIETTTVRTVTVTATCDYCGVVKTWPQENSTDDPNTLELGFYMSDPTPTWSPHEGWLWFDSSACVHAYVEANVIEALRHPENVRVPA